MKKSTTTPQPLDDPSVMPLPVKREHKTPIKHPWPGWWPHTNAAKLALGKGWRAATGYFSVQSPPSTKG